MRKSVLKQRTTQRKRCFKDKPSTEKRGGPACLLAEPVHGATEHAMPLFTIGHSNIRVEEFLDLLRQHGVEVLVDVRTAPYSRYCPQFNGPELRRAVEAAGVQYRFAGEALGGKPRDESLRGEDGTPDYDKIAASPLYQEGLSRLEVLAASIRVAIMCSEADPAQCHREKLIARSLRARGMEVTHILPDGSAAPIAQATLFE
jgi:uncharacterized protein (DUF488 family)